MTVNLTMRELQRLSAIELKDKLGNQTGIIYVDSQAMFKIKNWDTPVDSQSGKRENDSQANLPIYNVAVHKAGDKVLVRQGRRLVPTVVPELDGDGQPIPLLR